MVAMYTCLEGARTACWWSSCLATKSVDKQYLATTIKVVVSEAKGWIGKYQQKFDWAPLQHEFCGPQLLRVLQHM